LKLISAKREKKERKERKEKKKEAIFELAFCQQNVTFLGPSFPSFCCFFIYLFIYLS